MTIATDGFGFRSDLLTRKEAAAYLGVAVQTLAIWQCTRRYNLPIIKIGRLTKYSKADLDAFIERGRQLAIVKADPDAFIEKRRIAG